MDTNVSVQAVAQAARGTVTLREYMAYYLMERQGHANPLHRAGALFQEWTVIQWAKVEEHPSPYFRLFVLFAFNATVKAFVGICVMHH